MGKSDNTIYYEGTEYVPRYTPDWDKLTELLGKAKGPDRSMGKFADQCNISRATFTRIVRGYYVKALSKEMLNKIIENAAPDSGVTMKEMLRANGYAPQGSEADDANDFVSDRTAVDHKTRVADLLDIISRELYQRGLSFMLYAGDNNKEIIPESTLGLTAIDRFQAPWFLTFHIQGFEPYYIKFHGNMMNEKIIDSKENLWRALKPYYPLFLRDAWEPECSKDIMYCIVFTSESAFDIFAETMKEVRVNNYISSVLVDMDARRVKKEFLLPRNRKDSFQGIFNDL